MDKTAEHDRLRAHARREADWRRWGPYLAERAWGTVREDYSADGDAWRFFPHDHARSRAYRWNEDGLMGVCDREQHLCFALALWNEGDPILKERLFGLSNPEGNHGEDVKEVYYHLENTPAHSFMRMLYKYPQRGFPYDALLAENARRSRHDPEYELWHTGIFDEDRYFDVFVSYAKAAEDDMLIRLELLNRGPETASLHVLPTLWFRNTWSWGYPAGPKGKVPEKPRLHAAPKNALAALHPATGRYTLYAEDEGDLLFTENDTNAERLFGAQNASPYVKDAFHRYLIEGEAGAVNPARTGTKAAYHYRLELSPGATVTLRLRLKCGETEVPFADFDPLFQQRQREADAFYASLQNPRLSAEAKVVQRRALDGLLWNKQLYYYDLPQWLRGDPGQPPVPPGRQSGRNSEWRHLTNFDVLSMPDTWEYPWYAAWDTAFHCLPLALLDPSYAKRQLELLSREWYMHPNGQFPAYEWKFSDVNPPVHAWAAWRVYQLEAELHGASDRPFLEGMFHKLLLNFTWWVNRKDKDGNNIFQGGFLGLDNISVIDRSDLPVRGRLDQSDATSWMAAYCLTMLRIALELAKDEPIYQDSASKFFEHFLRIADAMTSSGHHGLSLWDEEDGFYYDALYLPDGHCERLRVRSLVGLLPLFATEVLEPGLLERLPVFHRRMSWFLENRPRIAADLMACQHLGQDGRRLLALLTPERLRRVLRPMLDKDEFLSPYGVRSLSKHHQAHPYHLKLDGVKHTVRYEPAESASGLYGGNSNWRGPVWFPVNFLIIEALERAHHFYGDAFKVECPTGSGRFKTLQEVAADLARRLTSLFLPAADGLRPCYGGETLFQQNPHFRDKVLFHEYFNGDDGAGLGASHQTGWTALVASLLQKYPC